MADATDTGAAAAVAVAEAAGNATPTAQIVGAVAAAAANSSLPATAAEALRQVELPVLVALAVLGLTAVLTIYFGSLAAANEKPEEDVEEISSEHAKWMPIRGSAVLFGLYLTFKYIPTEYVHLTLAGFICLMGALSFAWLAHRALLANIPALGRWLTPFELRLTQGAEALLEVDFDYAYLAMLALGVAFAGSYMTWKHWLVNDVLAVTLAMHTLRILRLDSFATGMILLAGLFFYDIFWVFGTDVMVTVAKSFDAPIKIVFPWNIWSTGSRLSMLGLGDIIVPGIFIVLALRFDRRHISTHGNQAYSKPYFTSTLIAYVIGLVTTFAVMLVFQAAQASGGSFISR